MKKQLIKYTKRVSAIRNNRQPIGGYCMTATAHINRQLFQSIIGQKKWTARDFHQRWIATYGLKMGYSNFMELMNNNISWKLEYAFAISEMLEVEIYDLFEFKRDI